MKGRGVFFPSSVIILNSSKLCDFNVTDLA